MYLSLRNPTGFSLELLMLIYSEDLNTYMITSFSITPVLEGDTSLREDTKDFLRWNVEVDFTLTLKQTIHN